VSHSLLTTLGVMGNPLWATLVIMLPLLAAALIVIVGHRSGPWFALAATVGVLVSLFKLAESVWINGPQEYPIGGWNAPLGIQWYADGLTVLMLLMMAIVGSLVTGYAVKSFRYSESIRFKTQKPPATPETTVKLLPRYENGVSHSTERLKYPLVSVADPPSTLPALVEESMDNRASSKSDYLLFWPLWLLLWSGLNGLLLSADLLNGYICLEIVTLATVPLLILKGGAMALGTGMRYLLIAWTASLFYLLGLVLLYRAFGTFDIQLLALEIGSGPTTWMAILLIIVGLLIKTSFFPFLFRAPAPVTALVAALVIKAPFYLLLRLWFEVFPTTVLPYISNILGALGALAIVWGGWQAVQQQRLTLLIAYGAVAQVGYLLLLFPLASGITDLWSLTAWQGGVYFAIGHAFAIAAMFLVADNIVQLLGTDHLDKLHGFGRIDPISLVTFALAGVSMMGGGLVASGLLLKAAWISHQWWWIGGIVTGGGLLAAAYVFKVLKPAFEKTISYQLAEPLPLSMKWIPLLLAIAAIVLGLVTTPLTLLEIGAPFEYEGQ